MKVTTGLVRLSYAHIFEPAEDPNGNMKYSASLIIPKSDTKGVQIIQDAIDRMLEDKDVINTLGGSTKNIRLPLRDGDTDRPKDAAYKDSLFFNANSNQDHRPKVFTRDRMEVVDPEEVYSGCWVQAVVNFYPYNKVSRGIGASLMAIRKIKDGEPLTGSVVTASDFNDDLLGDVTEDDLL